MGDDLNEYWRDGSNGESDSLSDATRQGFWESCSCPNLILPITRRFKTPKLLGKKDPLCEGEAKTNNQKISLIRTVTYLIPNLHLTSHSLIIMHIPSGRTRRETNKPRSAK